ncbi:MAG: hypothetical protein RRC34_00615 [Lentisphaeria bacterium]|nr:hypothetical protein [Lentisphaeria bacterium]
MKKRLVTWLAGLVILAPLMAASADQQVNLKLVLAKAAESGSTDKGLNDVEDLLKGNLSYGSYSLLGQKTVPLQANPRIILAEGVTVALSDVQKNSLNIRITQGDKQVLTARINLRAGKPAVLGGFSGNKGKMMVIVTLFSKHVE